MNITSEYKLANVAILVPIILLILAFFFYPSSTPASEIQEIRILADSYDVLIIVNPGGWGDATVNQATEFVPLLEGIQETLEQLGYTSVLIPYKRTPPGISGRISDLKAEFNSFDIASQTLADNIISLSKSYPQKNFIIAGFSNGGGFTEAVMEHIGYRKNVSAIIAGVPFWNKKYNLPNTLVLTNSGRDSIAAGNIREMTIAIIESPFRWIWSRLTHGNLNLATSFEFPGHAYPWSSPEVGPQVIHFLQSKFIPANHTNSLPVEQTDIIPVYP